MSFLDAHSLPNMGRELTIFEGKPDYFGLVDGLKNNKVVQTVEFFPESGKYHLTGHRKCGISQTPDGTNVLRKECPLCGDRFTVGVLHRVWELKSQVQTRRDCRRPYIKLVPLVELFALTMGRTRKANAVSRAYRLICNELGGKIQVLTKSRFDDLKRIGGENLAHAVIKIRAGQVELVAGFDGQYGVVRLAI